MASEKLTDEDRQWLLSGSKPMRVKALRIIDDLEARLAAAQIHVCVEAHRGNSAEARCAELEDAAYAYQMRCNRAEARCAELEAKSRKLTELAKAAGLKWADAEEATADLTYLLGIAQRELAQLRERVAKALGAAESVKGTYSHPYHLEQAVTTAFDRMLEALRGE